MMKKRCVFLSFLVLMSMLCGCDKVIKLTDAEEAAIAEYAAELLLKYDRGFESKYFEGEEMSTETTTEEIASTEASTEVATEVPTEASTEAAPQAPMEEVSTEDSSTELEATSTEAVQVSETDIAKILGLEGVSTTYNNYQICERYPSIDKNGDFIYLEATNGMKLIVVEFDMKNTTQEPIDVDLLNVDVKYTIVMNHSKAAKSMLTILMDDLSTYQATLAPAANEKAVLVFQIADNLVDQVQVLEIKVTYNNSENMITLT